jgi:hypothetical protein
MGKRRRATFQPFTCDCRQEHDFGKRGITDENLDQCRKFTKAPVVNLSQHFFYHPHVDSTC